MHTTQNSSTEGKNNLQTCTYLLMAGWLSRQNLKENKDDEIWGIKINIDVIQTTNIPNYMKIQQLYADHDQRWPPTTFKRKHKRLVPKQKWGTTRNMIILDIQRWMIVIQGIMLKDRWIIEPKELQNRDWINYTVTIRELKRWDC